MIIFKYIFREFFKVFLIVILSLILLFWIGDFFASINTLLRSQVSIPVIFKYFIFKTPLALYYVIPFSVLISAMYVFNKLNTNYEIIAFRTLRIKKRFFFFIFIIIGLIFYFILLFNNEFLLPRGYYYSKILKNVYIKKKYNYAVYKTDKIWYKKKNFIFKIDFADFENGFLRGITIFKFDSKFKLKQRIDAPIGFFIDNNWELFDVEITKITKDMSCKIKNLKTYILPVKIIKEDFFAITSDPMYLNILQIFKIIKNLKKTSIDTLKYKLYFLNKIAYPFTCMIFIFYGFILCIRNPREKSGITSIIFAIIFGFSFIFLHNLFINLGAIKIIPYYIAPFISFILGIIIFKYIGKKANY